MPASIAKHHCDQVTNSNAQVLRQAAVQVFNNMSNEEIRQAVVAPPEDIANIVMLKTVQEMERFLAHEPQCNPTALSLFATTLFTTALTLFELDHLVCDHLNKSR